MARVIPNQQSYICFVPTIAASDLNPAPTEISSGVNLTSFVISLNASTTGNTVATPSFDTTFETSIQGTVTATFSLDIYRDTVADTAWTTLPRNTTGYIVISRFGGTGANNMPVLNNKVEVWPIIVTSRAMQNMTSNTAQTATVTCAVPSVPNEAAVVGAG